MHYKYTDIEQLERVLPFFEQYDGDVVIQEKFDGSNVAVVKKGNELTLQSRTTVINRDSPSMFSHFASWVKSKEEFFLGTTNDWILYGEMLGNGKVKYKEKSPFLLFDVAHLIDDNLMFHHNIDVVSSIYDIPTVPTLYRGRWQGVEHVRNLLYQIVADRDYLVEGVVVKGYGVPIWFTSADGVLREHFAPILGGKLVTASYKETKPVRKIENSDDPLAEIAKAMVTEPRFQKVWRRLEEEGKDTTKPHLFIGPMAQDIMKEEEHTIKELLFKRYWKEMNRHIAQTTLALYNQNVAVKGAE